MRRSLLRVGTAAAVVVAAVHLYLQVGMILGLELSSLDEPGPYWPFWVAYAAFLVALVAFPAAGVVEFVRRRRDRSS